MEKKHSLKYYPIALKLNKAKVLVIGGGTIAQRKVLSFIESGAFITVVSPKITSLLKNFFDNKKIKWIKKCVSQDDLLDIDIVISATNDSVVNEKVSVWAHNLGIFINVVDNLSLSNFISPAVFYSEQGVIAVYTDGKNPEFSRDLKNFLKEKWNEFLSYRNRL